MNLFEGIAQFVYKFLKILSHARINFEEQIKNLGASIIIVNSWINIINVYNNCNRRNNSKYKYIIFKMKASTRNAVRWVI